MSLYYSKEGLYKEISRLKKFLGINESHYGFDLIEILQHNNFLLKSIPFQTKGLRGMAIIGHEDLEDVILLNSNRNHVEQNFDCGHEMIHLALHRKIEQKTFNCFDKLQVNQNPFIEWQANEGSAEFFVPYKIFLPMIAECYPLLDNYSNIDFFKREMAEIFNVPEAVIKYRIENLKYETTQYLSGIPLDEIEILSAKKQEERNIYTISLNQISDDDFARRMNKYWGIKIS